MVTVYTCNGDMLTGVMLTVYTCNGDMLTCVMSIHGDMFKGQTSMVGDCSVSVTLTPAR